MFSATQNHQNRHGFGNRPTTPQITYGMGGKTPSHCTTAVESNGFSTTGRRRIGPCCLHKRHRFGIHCHGCCHNVPHHDTQSSSRTLIHFSLNSDKAPTPNDTKRRQPYRSRHAGSSAAPNVTQAPAQSASNNENNPSGRRGGSPRVMT